MRTKAFLNLNFLIQYFIVTTLFLSQIFWDKIRLFFEIFCGQWYLKNNYHNQIKNIPSNNNSNYFDYNYYIFTILTRFKLSLKPKSIQWVVTSKQLNLVLSYCSSWLRLRLNTIMGFKHDPPTQKPNTGNFLKNSSLHG